MLSAGSHITAELAGLNQGIDYDLIAVTGTAALDGTLDVIYTGGFNAASASAFDLLTYANASGGFASVLGPLGVTFTASDLGTFFQFFIGQPPAPTTPVVPELSPDPVIPELGTEAVIGTLPTEVMEPGETIDGLFFGPTETFDTDLPDGKAAVKCG